MHSQGIPNYIPFYRYNEIYTAIAKPTPDLKEIETLVKTSGIDVEMDAFYKLRPIHIACLLGKLNVVELLVTKLGANLESGTYSPLAYACRDWHISDCKVALFLINHGADLNFNLSLGCSNDDLLSLIRNLYALKSCRQSRKGSLELEIAKLFEKLKDPVEAQKYFRLAIEHRNIDALPHVTKQQEIPHLLEMGITGLRGKENEMLIQSLENIASPSAESKDITPQQQFEARMALGRIHAKYRESQKSVKHYEKAHGLKEAKKTPETEAFLLTCLPFNNKYREYYDLRTNLFPEDIYLNTLANRASAAAQGSMEAPLFFLDSNGRYSNYDRVSESFFYLKIESYSKKAVEIQKRYNKYTEALKERNNPRRFVLLLQKLLNEGCEDKFDIQFSLADAAARVSIDSIDSSNMTTFRKLSFNLYQQIVDLNPTPFQSAHCIFVLLKLFNHLTDKTEEKPIIDLVMRFYQHSHHFQFTTHNLEFLLTKTPDSFVLNHALARCYRFCTTKDHLEKSIQYFEAAAKCDATEREAITKEINSIRKQISEITNVSQKETKQGEVMTMFRGAAIQQACGNKDAKAIATSLTTSVATVTGSIVDHAEDFIKLEIIPAYEFASESFLAANPELAKVLISKAYELLTSDKLSAELRRFFEYYINDNEKNIRALQAMALKGYLPALVSLMEIYKNKGKTHRERAQILLKTCVLMINPRATLLVSKIYADKLVKLKTEALIDLEELNRDKTAYPTGSKKFLYSWLASQCYALHQDLKDQYPSNPLAYILGKLKTNESLKMREVDIYTDALVHAVQDAFDYKIGFVEESLPKDPLVTEPVLKGVTAKTAPPILETKNSQTLPKLDWFISDTPQTKLLTYTAFLLKHADLSKLILKSSEYFLHLQNISERRDLKVMSRFAKWCLAQIDRVERAQDKPLNYLLENALQSNDELISQTFFEARDELETLDLIKIIETQSTQTIAMLNHQHNRPHADVALLTTSKPLYSDAQFQNPSVDNYVPASHGQAYGHFVDSDTYTSAAPPGRAENDFRREMEAKYAQRQPATAKRTANMAGPGVFGQPVPAPCPEIAMTLTAQLNHPLPSAPSFAIVPGSPPAPHAAALAVAPIAAVAVAPAPAVAVAVAPSVAPISLTYAAAPRKPIEKSLVELFGTDLFTTPAIAAPASNIDLLDFTKLNASLAKDIEADVAIRNKEQEVKAKWEAFNKESNNALALTQEEDDVFAGLDFPRASSFAPGNSTAKMILGAGMNPTEMEQGLLKSAIQPAQVAPVASPAVVILPAPSADSHKRDEPKRTVVALV